MVQREGQLPEWAETRPSRGSGSASFATTYGPTARAFRAGARPNGSSCTEQSHAAPKVQHASYPARSIAFREIDSYFVRGVANIGALAARAGMVLKPRSVICRRKALV